MKKTIALLTMAAAGVALAGAVESADTFGVLKITSSTTETAISVPWVAAGITDGETNIVKNLVKTANLTGSDTVANADKLLLYTPSTGTYKGWYLNNSKVWTGANISYNNINAEGGTDADMLTRGDALILIRQSVSDTAIYLYGQYKTGPASYTITRAAGRKTLFAPVNVSGRALSLNNHMNWTNAQDGDIIQLQGSDGKLRTFTYDSTKDSKWGRKGISTSWITTGTEIQAGQGAWYTTVSGTGEDVTVTLE